MFFTPAKDLQLVTDHYHIVFFADFLLTIFDQLITKLDHFTALHTDQMIVMRHIKSQLIAGKIIPQIFFCNNPDLREQIQGPIDGSSGNMSMVLSDMVKQLLRVKMIGKLEYFFQNSQSFIGKAQIIFLKKLTQLIKGCLKI